MRYFTSYLKKVILLRNSRYPPTLPTSMFSWQVFNELKNAGLGILLTVILGLLQSLYKDLVKDKTMHRHLCARETELRSVLIPFRGVFLAAIEYVLKQTYGLEI